MAKMRYRRRSIRLKGYDYTQPGAYFITICTCRRAWLFGEVVDGEMRLNALGNVARQCWLSIPDHFPHTVLDEFVIMPNHVHGIIWIVDDPAGAGAENVGAKNVGAKNVGAKNLSPLPPPPPHTGAENVGAENVGAGAKNLSPLRSPLRSPLPLPPSPSSPSPERPRGTSRTIGSVVRGFKIGVTKWARQHTDIHTVWQRNYYEHIIRDDRALNAIRRYIAENPLRWHLDRYNPNAVARDPLAGEIWQMLQDAPQQEAKKRDITQNFSDFS